MMNNSSLVHHRVLPSSAAVQAENIGLSVMLVVFALIGITGNLLVILVYFRRHLQLTGVFFIKVLSIVDFTISLLVIPSTLAMLLAGAYVKFDLICKGYVFITTSQVPLSAMLMALISLDRYLCICRPHENPMTVNRAKVVVLIVLLATCVLATFPSLLHGVYKQRLIWSLNDANIGNGTTGNLSLVNLTMPEEKRIISTYTGYCTRNTLFFSKDDYTIIMYAHSGVFFLSCLISTTFYVLVYRFVTARQRKLAEKRHTMERTINTGSLGGGESSCGRAGSSSNWSARRHEDFKQNIRIASMLFIVSAIFIICVLPAMLMGLKWVPYHRIIFYIYFVNNIANSMVYSFMNKQFRLRLLMLFCREKYRQRALALSMMEITRTPNERRRVTAPSMILEEADEEPHAPNQLITHC